jgi:hypothetical protein
MTAPAQIALSETDDSYAAEWQGREWTVTVAAVHSRDIVICRATPGAGTAAFQAFECGEKRTCPRGGEYPSLAACEAALPAAVTVVSVHMDARLDRLARRALRGEVDR